MEKLVHLTLIPDTTGKNLKPAKFASFKEMYEAFKFIETKNNYVKTDSVKASFGSASKFKTNDVSPQVTTGSFNFAVTDQTIITGSLNLGQLSDVYSVNYGVRYTYIPSSHTYYVENLATTTTKPQVAYGGPGTVCKYFDGLGSACGLRKFCRGTSRLRHGSIRNLFCRSELYR